MNVVKKAKLELAKMLNLKFSEIATDKGELQYDGELEVGTEVYIYDAEGEITIPADGDYKTETRVLTIEAGIVTNIDPQDEVIDTEMEVDEETVEEANELEGVDEVIAESELVEKYEDLAEQFNTVVSIVKDLTDELAEVKTEVEEFRTDFKKVTKLSVQRPADEEIEVIANRQSELSKFGIK